MPSSQNLSLSYRLRRPRFCIRVLGPAGLSCVWEVVLIARDTTTVRPLRDHMVQRNPTAREQATRHALSLTSRDEAILAAIATHGLLTTEIIELAFFPTPADIDAQRGAPCSRAYHRLRQLWLWGFIERIELPVARVLGGRRAYLYTLGERGHRHVAGQVGSTIALPEPRRLDRMDDRFVEHDLRIARLWAHMEASVRQGQFRSCDLKPERDLHARDIKVPDPKTGRPIAMLPDGYVELERLDSSLWSAMVEIDMGTLTLGRFRRKVRAFQVYVTTGQFQQHWHRDQCAYLVVTTSWKRLKNLWKAARLELPSTCWSDCRLATAAVLSPERFSSSDAWLTLDGDYVRLC